MLEGLSEKEKAESRKKIAKLLRKQQNLKKIKEANKSLLTGQADIPLVVTPPERKPFVVIQDDMRPAIKMNEYVKIASDTSPGKNRPEGFGYVVKAAGVGGATIVSVKLRDVDGGTTHHSIPLADVTPAIFGQEFDQPRPQRKRPPSPVQSESKMEQKKPKLDTRPPIVILMEKLKHGARYNKKRGWYRQERRDALELIRMKSGASAPNEKIRNGTIQMSPDEKQQLYNEVCLLEQFLNSSDNQKEKLRDSRTGAFKERTTIHDPLTTKYLVQEAWGLGNQFLSQLRDQVAKLAEEALGINDGVSLLVDPKSEYCDEEPAASVIDDYSLAEKTYTVDHLYALNECRRLAAEDLKSISKKAYRKRYNTARRSYDKLPNETKALWEMKLREHLLRQGRIIIDITDAIRKNPRRSWEGIEKDIEHWCSAATIRRWVTSRAGYKLYCERVIPLLNPNQKLSQLTFAKHFRNNWGLGAGKYLLIMYDEKWFWGLVTRKAARCCEELGINPHTFKAYHKSHINKTMGVAFVCFAFEDCIENGGVAMKLEFLRAQSHKVAERQVREGSRNDVTGRMEYNGDIVRNRDDTYLVDCCVTGSNEGSADNPKFPLLNAFRDNIFKKVEKLVGPGGDFEGYTPIFQGDNAGPHQDKPFMKFVTEYCEEKGWHWEPQAAQMPHMNVLDLSVFPCMSRRHIAKAREVGGLRVLSENDIWSCAQDVWNELPNSKIASGFVQAYRIAGEVIKHGGDNCFLGVGGTPHVGVRSDFDETANGLARKDNKVFKAP